MLYFLSFKLLIEGALMGEEGAAKWRAGHYEIVALLELASFL